ncbi:MAG: DUF2294 domain-containing protein [Spirirestis rafaelensis WJT71-NPBG6]|jgi:uncharacterized protein YbcI|nr:DUF2294 domain-containing protein [Spirirestis rafaelensis WJT71-NPBG6]
MARPSIGQLEREISQGISSLYNTQLGLRPSKVICHCFDKEIVITLEDSVTLVEQALIDGNYRKLAEEIRVTLNKIIKPQIKDLIEEIIDRNVIDVISNSSLATNRTGIIAILEQSPAVRNPESIPKVDLKSIPD